MTLHPYRCKTGYFLALIPLMYLVNLIATINPLYITFVPEVVRLFQWYNTKKILKK